jgi:hypothetical protein
MTVPASFAVALLGSGEDLCAYVASLEGRLQAWRPLSGRLVIEVTNVVPTAMMYWSAPSTAAHISWNHSMVSGWADLEFDALCAHEYCHALGWWGRQEPAWFLNPDGTERVHATDPAAKRLHWRFELQSDAFAGDFAGLDPTLSMLSKVAAWADANPAKDSERRLDPHPPCERRIAFLRRRGAARSRKP